MPGNSFGTIFRITTFGESHGKAMGCVIDGCPAGLPLDTEDIAKELRRRRPGQGEAFSSSRKEEDIPEILSGLYEGKTMGTPIAIIVKNNDQKPGDYHEVKDCYRPGHADWCWDAKYGSRGGRLPCQTGRSSGRETVSRVAAGAVARVFLAAQGITVRSWVNSAAGIEIDPSGKTEDANARMEGLKAAGDSAGCIIACTISGLPAGLGEPVFNKLDALISHAILSVGGCKGVEFGAGFAAASLTGRENNDAPALPPHYAASAGGSPATEGAALKEAAFKSNNSGGVLGGISNGMDVFFRAAFKAPPSIGAVQGTIDCNGNPVNITIKGRHDICLAPRVLPVVEAMAALVIADFLLLQRCDRI